MKASKLPSSSTKQPTLTASTSAWRRITQTLITSALAAAVISAQPLRAAEEVPATGELPPTAKDIEWMNANALKVGAVKLNPLALQRLNNHRASLGLPALNLVTVPLGLEVTPRLAAFNATPPADTTPALPPAVDNSTLPCFPPIGNQGGIGSCVAWATTYYMGTHMLGLARGTDHSDPADLSTKLSPKWTYNLLNGGVDEGMTTPPALELLLKNGAPTWAEFPYASSASVPANYLEWSRDAAVWRSAVHHRFASIGEVTDLHTAAGRNQLRTLLSNGYVCVFSTSISNWVFRTIRDDPSTSADNAFAGRRICAYTQNNSFGHKMTVVGYNDDIWVDLNQNRQVDAGEKGAFRIANSWGTSWEESGFSWLCYDALRATSAVSGAENTSRSAAWGNNAAQFIVARSSYTPSLLAEFSLSAARRNQLSVSVGRSAATATSPTSTFVSGALRHHGGGFGFSGSSSNLTGAFVLDLSDLVQGSSRYYLNLTDNASGSPLLLQHFQLTDANGRPLGNASIGSQGSVDNRSARFFTSLGLNALDDVGDHGNAAKVVVIPSLHAGQIEVISDQDVYRFNLAVASNVTVSTTGDLDTVGSLYSPSGSRLSENDDANGSRNFLINHSLAAGTYYLIVSSRNFQSAGAYRIQFAATPLPAPRMAISGQNGLLNVNIQDGSNAPLSLNGTVFANISASGASSSRSFTLRNTGTGPLVLSGSPAVQITGSHASSFRVIAQPVTSLDVGAATSFRIEYAPQSAGTHLATVTLFSNDVSTSPFTFAIKGTASFPRDDHGNSFEKATRINRPSTTAGNINGAADTDCFVLALTSTTTVTIRSTGTTDTTAAVFHANGTLLTGHDNTSSTDRNFKIKVQLPAGIYFIQVAGAASTVTGNYSLRLE